MGENTQAAKTIEVLRFIFASYHKSPFKCQRHRLTVSLYWMSFDLLQRQ